MQNRGPAILIFVALMLAHTVFPVQKAQAQRLIPCDEIDQIPFDECKALELLFWDTNGPEWISTGKWLITNQPCSWLGITCNATFWPRNVTGIEFVNNNLNGPLPPELSFLTELTHLVIENNPVSGDLLWLTGNIPSAITDLQHLRVLKLNYQRLTGELPAQLGRLEHLEVLELSNNLIDDFLPVDYGNFKSLRTMDLSNNLLKGRIPASFGRLDSLRTLDLSHNQLGDLLPDSLGNLRNLFKLNLEGNQFTGRLPASFSGMSNLSWLSLNDNALYGPVHPGVIHRADKLEFCSLENNKAINNTASLCLPDRALSSSQNGTNQLCGLTADPSCSICEDQNLTIPSTSCMALEALYYDTDGVNWQDASGWLANDDPCSWFGINCTSDMSGRNVNAVVLSNNNLAGKLSPQAGLLPALSTLDLSLNNITGPVPFSLALLGAGANACSLAQINDSLCMPADSQFTALGLPIICELPLTTSCTVTVATGPTRFDASLDNNLIRFTWQLALQTRDLSFELEKKQGDSFVTIDAFSFEDAIQGGNLFTREIPRPARGIHTFRLKQISSAGDILTSNTIEVIVDQNAGIIVDDVYPNPAASSATFQFAPTTGQNIQIDLFDALGRHIRTLMPSAHTEEVVHTVYIDLNNLAGGMYFILIQGESFSISRPLMLVR